MWCPVCESEFVEGIAECAECQVPLVKSLPDENGVPLTPENWEVVAEMNDETAANLAEGLLLENGIECHVENLTFHAGAVPISGDLSQIRIWVKPEDEAAAKKLLSEAENFELCSDCGSAVLEEDSECQECGTPLEEDKH